MMRALGTGRRMGVIARRYGAVVLLGTCSLALAAVPDCAHADESLLNSPVSVDGTASGACFLTSTTGPGVKSFTIRPPDYGYLRVTLSGGSGDWDVAAFSAGRVVAAGATAGADEVATGFALGHGEQILVRACRNAGAAGTPSLRVSLHPLPSPTSVRRPQLLRVATPDRAAREALLRTGVDIAGAEAGASADVVSYGSGDRRSLRAAGLRFDVARRSLDARADGRGAAATRASAAQAATLPSGRDSYRRLFDYEQEMKDLAAAHPDLVRLFTLPHRTGEGRAVEGIEIDDHPGADDGKPAFLDLGLHHAREWPTGEIALEWAYQLLHAAAAGDRHALATLRKERTLVVPVVNPDGFNLSREAGEVPVDYRARLGEPGAPIPTLLEEEQRKNCRLSNRSVHGDCGRVGSGTEALGVDVNRNYGGLWGGVGTELATSGTTYRGSGPFSEPETRNVRSLFATNQVTAALTNHTFGGQILRPPVVRSMPGRTPDNGLYRRLGARLAKATGYESTTIPKGQYDASGVMEGWSYYTAGSISFTPEIGTSDGFHPPFHDVIDAWNGPTKHADGGMRAATGDLARFARKPFGHVVVSGQGPADGRILFRERFRTKTLPVLGADGKLRKPVRFRDHRKSTVDVGADGRFSAHLNPSTRPILEQRKSGRRRERWKLICYDAAGQRTGHRRLYADRGDRVHLDLSSGC